MSSTEKHRNYITTFRNDISYSALYRAHEDKFIKIAEGEGQGNLKEKVYKMDNVQNILMNNFLESRNLGLLWNKSNVNPVTGKPTIVDPKQYWGLAA